MRGFNYTAMAAAIALGSMGTLRTEAELTKTPPPAAPAAPGEPETWKQRERRLRYQADRRK